MEYELLNIVVKELENPTFAVLRQLLNVLEIEFLNGKPKVASIVINQTEQKAEVHIEVKNESFYVTFYFEFKEDIALIFIGTSPYINVSFGPSSTKFNIQEFLNFTTIEPSDIVEASKKSDPNTLYFESFKKPGDIEQKISYLLDNFEKDVLGIKRLIEKTETNNLFITVVHHIGSGNFTGLWVNSEIINRLSNFGLSLTFDIYSMGKEFR